MLLRLLSLLVFSILSWLQSYGQDSFYNHIRFGHYKIGYGDTIIYNDRVAYDQFGYKGAAPMFIQIWYPLKKQPKGSYLTYGDLEKRSLPENLKPVYKEWGDKTDTCFIDYNISPSLPDEEMINYGIYQYNDVLKDIKSFTTRSFYSGFPDKSDFPVIVYHHGSQGSPHENFIMAEYFASRGYIFISTSFHLPYQNMQLGHEPFWGEERFQNDLSTSKRLVQFAKSLTVNGKIFYAGHSWGAQTGWCFLHEKGQVDGFVSMETTIEYKTDTLKIKEMWPHVYNTVKTQKKSYPIPILLFAGTEEDKPFYFFENSSNKEMIFASPKKPFAHNSYTSVFLMRYFYREKYIQPDNELLKTQVDLYLWHIKMVDSFFESIRQNKPFKKEPFTDLFYIN